MRWTFPVQVQGEARRLLRATGLFSRHSGRHRDQAGQVGAAPETGARECMREGAAMHSD